MDSTHCGERPRLGASACLLGEAVRYDGGHKCCEILRRELAAQVELVPVCPEVEMGLPVPRNTLQLIGRPDRPRLVEGATGIDHTATMERWAAARVAELARLGLDGYVLKSRSPSCGLAGVPVAADPKMARPPDGPSSAASGAGLFAAALRRALPDLPVCEETWLESPSRRAAFLDQVVAHHRLRTAAPGRPR